MASESGIVKWFSNGKGYGFIQRDNGLSDLFVHYSKIVKDGYKTLNENEIVTFDVQMSNGKEQAINVVGER